jgi:hypothetical protein
MNICDAECCAYVTQFAQEYFAEKTGRPTWGGSFLSFEQFNEL